MQRPFPNGSDRSFQIAALLARILITPETSLIPPTSPVEMGEAEGLQLVHLYYLSLPLRPPSAPAWAVRWAGLCIWPSALLRKRIRQEAFIFIFLFLSLPLRPPSSPAWAMGWVGLPCGCGIVGVFSYDPGLERLNYFLPSSSPFSFVFLFRY